MLSASLPLMSAKAGCTTEGSAPYKTGNTSRDSRLQDLAAQIRRHDKDASMETQPTAFLTSRPRGSRIARSRNIEMIGQMFAHYRVLEKLGGGAMGDVYRAHDEQLDRDVAIKVLPSDTVGDPVSRTRLLGEARAAAALNHPHVCTVHEVGEAGGQVYVAMELVPGQRLDRLIPKGGLPIDDVRRYGLQIAEAVAHAHDHGVVHRDLKAANTFVTPEGRAKVLDFGLAKRVGGEDSSDTTTAVASLNQMGVLVGTLPYMAPEQLSGE